MTTWNRNISMRAMRAFCAAAKHESFRAAADDLYLTASAVSHQIKKLEQALGSQTVRAQISRPDTDGIWPSLLRRPPPDSADTGCNYRTSLDPAGARLAQDIGQALLRERGLAPATSGDSTNDFPGWTSMSTPTTSLRSSRTSRFEYFNHRRRVYLATGYSLFDWSR